MTQRLYYDDSYLCRFTAQVTNVLQKDFTTVVYLDRSAFYPTSGGQPYDMGTLGGCEIKDVYVDESGDVAHVIEGSLSVGDEVEGVIDWDRRFDHMQQHAGEHMLAGCVYRQLGGYTNGLHLGKEISTIDVDLPDGRTRISDDEIKALEDEVNRHIQADEKIICRFPDAKEFETLPLRKAPAVSEHIRVVQIGDWEYCACGGTHPSSTGQIAIVKIVDARPSKGKLRISFVCGERAFKEFQKHMSAVKQLSAILSANLENLPSAASELDRRLKDALYNLNREKTERALDMLKYRSENAVETGGALVHRHMLTDISADGLKEIASQIIASPDSIALLASKTNDSCLLLFARGANVKFDMGTLMRETAKLWQGKGGGSADFARGSCISDKALDTALEILKAQGGKA